MNSYDDRNTVLDVTIPVNQAGLCAAKCLTYISARLTNASRLKSLMTSTIVAAGGVHERGNNRWTTPLVISVYGHG